MISPGFASRHDLLQWADTITARSELPRLLRRLILETGRGLVQPGFPAGEGVAAGGWDGTLVATEPAPYIPAGLSVWELSVERSAGSKADRDYIKRNATPDGSSTHNCTYVAAALRPWTKRQTWAATRTAEAKWKEVRALGVDDIETWLENAPVTHAWISQILGLNPFGLRAIDLWWDTWAAATTPAMTPALILAGRSSQQTELIQRLKGPAQVTTIKAGSLDELQSFIAATLIQAALDGDDQIKARAAFVDDLATWRALFARPNPLVLIPITEELHKDIPQTSSHHIVIPLTDAAMADLELPPIDAEAAATVLHDIGVDDTKARRLARLGRRSLLTMRRELANKPELHQPAWAKPPVSRTTRGLLLAGRWQEDYEGDRGVLSSLSGSSYEDVRERLVEMAAHADPFVGHVGAVWALVSAYDAWSQLAGRIQPDDLERLRPIVSTVLGELDPSLDLPQGDRWRAAMEGRVRAYSPELRKGLASTLALVGVHGERVDAGAAGNGSDWTAVCVGRLLQAANADPTCNTWISLADVLTLLAEASPDAFLAAVTKGLDGESPLLASLFVEDTSPFGGGNHHTHLLWALESVVWSDLHFGQAVDTLARLAEIDPGGRLSNRPAASLAAIFRPWHPDNSVDVSRRLAALDAMRNRHPTVAWPLMLTMLPESHGVHFPSHEPAYRGWKPAKVTVTFAEYLKVTSEVVARVVDDAGSDAARWVQVLDDISDLTPADRETVLRALKARIETGAFSDDDRAKLWESLRSVTAGHREHSDASWALPAEELAKIDEVESMLKPTSPMQRHVWIFKSYTPEIPDHSLRDDHQAWEAAVLQHRSDAVADIDADGGLGALRQLAQEAEQVSWVGVAIADASEAKYEDELLAMLGSADRIDAELGASYVARRFNQGGWTWTEDVLQRVTSLTPGQRAVLLVQTRDYPTAWLRADELGEEVAVEFWKRFGPYGLGNFEHVLYAAGHLIQVGRNAVAIALIEIYINRDGADLPGLLELAATALEALLTSEDPEIGYLRQYNFQELFELFYQHREAVGWERIARLEWAYLPALGYDAQPRMLNDLLARDPGFFVEMISAAFRPASSDEERELTEEDQRRALNAYRLLNEWSTPPGMQPDGHIDAVALAEWMSQATERLSEVDRPTIGLQKIGQVLTKAPEDQGGGWPSLVVRELLETQQSEALEEGFFIGVVNSRGVTTRSPGDGGDQERTLAAKYRGRAEECADQWPRTAAVMRSLADRYEHDARREDRSAERFRSGLDE